MPDNSPTRREELQIGRILVENDLISSEQLQECTTLQQQVKEVGGSILLGELLMQKGYLDEPSLKGALAVQNARLTQAIQAVLPKPRAQVSDLSFGQIALKNGLIVQAQLDDALETQKKIRALGVEKRLGEILIDWGLVSRDAIEGLANVQERRVKKATEQELKAVGAPLPPAADTKLLLPVPDAWLERVIAESKILPASVMKECREVQTKLAGMGVSKSLGAILLSKGYLTLEAAKRLVAQHRTGAPVEPKEVSERKGLATKDWAALVLMTLLLLYIVFRDRKSAEGPSPQAPAPAPSAPLPPPSPPPPPTSQPGPPPVAPPRATALVNLPPDELDRRAARLLQEGTLSAHGALMEARGLLRGAENGTSFGPNAAFHTNEFERWFANWEGRVQSISQREPDLREQVKSTPRGEALKKMDEAVKLVDAFGRARRAEVVRFLHLPPHSEVAAPSDPPASLLSQARAALAGIAQAAGFDLPEVGDEDGGSADGR